MNGEPCAGARPDSTTPLPTPAVHASEIPIVYTRAEWDAFLAGVRDGEFDLPTP